MNQPYDVGLVPCTPGRQANHLHGARPAAMLGLTHTQTHTHRTGHVCGYVCMHIRMYMLNAGTCLHTHKHPTLLAPTLPRTSHPPPLSSPTAPVNWHQTMCTSGSRPRAPSLAPALKVKKVVWCQKLVTGRCSAAESSNPTLSSTCVFKLQAPLSHEGHGCPEALRLNAVDENPLRTAVCSEQVCTCSHPAAPCSPPANLRKCTRLHARLRASTLPFDLQSMCS